MKFNKLFIFWIFYWSCCDSNETCTKSLQCSDVTVYLEYTVTSLVISHDAPHLQRVPDGQQSMLSVRPSSLAGGAQVVVWTDRTLEASSHHGAVAAVAGDVRVEGGGRCHVRGRGLRSSGRWRRRVAEEERREGMKRKVSTVLLFLWKNSIKQKFWLNHSIKTSINLI